MPKSINIHWFRRDLRIADNPSLTAASTDATVLPIYIIDNENAGDFCEGGASNWWLNQSLQQLNQSLNGQLYIFRGSPQYIIEQLCKSLNIDKVCWNRCYEPWQIKRDSHIKSTLVASGIEVCSFNGSLLVEPWTVTKGDGTPYKIFTPFYRKLGLISPRFISSAPNLSTLKKLPLKVKSTPIDSLNLLGKTTWYKKLEEHNSPGEDGAQNALNKFLESNLDSYQEGRDYPAKNSVSRLSPHIHFGEISPSQILHALSKQKASNNTEHFLRELCWREFSYYLLYHCPDMPTSNLKKKFQFFPWKNDSDLLAKWQQGQTGFPIVDAGMRELWQTGFMHNRVRMVVASFLVKNLLVHWHHGAAWFWDCLVDADLASNSASWQWVAGCGTDASPFFRIFNPVTQGEKFDANGQYTRHFVPELKNLPSMYLFKPWLAPKAVLQEAGIELGNNYPWPIVDIQESRQQALEAFQLIKELDG